MKIIFAAMMFVFSAGAWADDGNAEATQPAGATEQQEASEPLGANGFPLRYNKMSEEEKGDWGDHVFYGLPLRWRKMSKEEQDAWHERKQQQKDENERQQILDHAEDLKSPQCVAALEADIKGSPDEYPGYEHTGLSPIQYLEVVARSRERVKRKCVDDIKEARKETAIAKEHEATKPKCTNIRFTGVATSPYYRSAIAQVLASHDIEDTLARNPIRCDGEYNIFGKHNCTGVAFLRNHKGQIVNWDKNFYIIDTPLDFSIGRRNVELAIRRQDAACTK